MSNKISNNNQKSVIAPEFQPSHGQAKREELEALSDSALDERYIYAFGSTGPEMEREAVIAAIMANTPAPPAPVLPEEEVAVNTTREIKDSNGKSWQITPDTKGSIVVRQVVVQELNGGMVEVPNTETLQTYTKETFDRLQEQGFFEESKMKVEILSK